MNVPPTISGTNSLHAVIYVSRATHQSATTAYVEDILAVSRRNNCRDFVTGALLVCGAWFVQALEGRRLDVEQTLRRIERDPSHTAIRRLHAGPIAQRAFGEWNMCASILSPTDAQIVSVLDTSGKFDPAALGPASAMRLLLSVARLQVTTGAHT